MEKELHVMAWVVDPDDTSLFPYALAALRQSEPSDTVKLVGISGPFPVQAENAGGAVPYLKPEELPRLEFDILLILSGLKHRKKTGDTRKALLALGLDERTFLFDFIACTPGFSWRKYQMLRKSRLSILSFHCFGGIISHSLGLRFRSPTINMFFEEGGFLQFLRHPRTYLDGSLTFVRTEHEESLDIDYPVYRLGDDVLIHMNHYPDRRKAEAVWYERVHRINWYNLFAVMYTERPEIAAAFDELPYGKKVCFVPFRSELDSSWQIDTKALGKELPLWDAVNRFATGAPFFYDPFDMLLYGKKTQLIDLP